MPRLVKADFAASRQADRSDRSPPFFMNLRTRYALLAKRLDLSPQILTHEIKLVPAILRGWMKRGFRRGQREDQPSATGVHGRKSENIPEEYAISFRIFAVYDYMSAENHDLLLLSLRFIGWGGVERLCRQPHPYRLAVRS
jgi:hypothetical protein